MSHRADAVRRLTSLTFASGARGVEDGAEGGEGGAGAAGAGVDTRLVVLYGSHGAAEGVQGPTVTFNVKRRDGSVISPSEVCMCVGWGWEGGKGRGQYQ